MLYCMDMLLPRSVVSACPDASFLTFVNGLCTYVLIYCQIKIYNYNYKANLIYETEIKQTANQPTASNRKAIIDSLLSQDSNNFEISETVSLIIKETRMVIH